jgi:hypothetical protein
MSTTANEKEMMEAHETLDQRKAMEQSLGRDTGMTGADLDALPSGEVFRTGLVVDSPDGVHMTGSGRMLRFVATKGHANDWAVYVYWAEYDELYVRQNGDKVIGSVNIRRCVPCNSEVMARYRY